MIGWLRSKVPTLLPWQEGLADVQRNLMKAMTHAATPAGTRDDILPSLEGASLAVETWLDDIESRLGTPTNQFILPGGTEVSAICHLVRVRVRSAERTLVAVHEESPIDSEVLRYVNRLSDLFFKLAREETESAGVEEEPWKPFRGKKQEN